MQADHVDDLRACRDVALRPLRGAATALCAGSKKTTSPSLNSFETTGCGNPAGGPLLAEVVRVTQCARRGWHCWPHIPNQVATLDSAKVSGSIACGQAGGAIAPAHRDRTQPALKVL
jgi:hypothetical protein